jgi:hypothetical protein
VLAGLLEAFGEPLPVSGEAFTDQENREEPHAGWIRILRATTWQRKKDG